jgi:hypothetical protein
MSEAVGWRSDGAGGDLYKDESGGTHNNLLFSQPLILVSLCVEEREMASLSRATGIAS